MARSLLSGMVTDVILDARARSVAGIVFSGFPCSAEQVSSFCANDNSPSDAQLVIVRNAQQETSFVQAAQESPMTCIFHDGKWGMGSPEGLEQCAKMMLRRGGAFGNDASSGGEDVTEDR